MKRVLAVVAVACLMTATADAATLRLAWAGGSVDTLAVDPMGSAQIEVWVDIVATDTLGTVFFEWEANPIDQTGLATTMPGWGTGGMNGTMGDLGVQFASAAATIPDAVAGPGSFLVGTADITLQGGLESDQYEIAMKDLRPNHPAVLNATAGAYTFAPAYAGLAGYYTVGKGSPGMDAGPFGVADRDPLLMHVTPEPASLLLLGLGGLAIVNRRR